MKIFDPKLTGSIEIQNTITGDVTLSGNLIVDGNLQGAVTASATASYVDFDNIDSKPTLLSGSAQIASDISGSFTSLSSSVASGLLKNTTDTLTGDLTVTGTLTAQEFHTEFTSASVIYESGSTQFGNTNDDRHLFTGRVGIGTTDPQEELDIASAGPGIQLTDTDGGTARIINLGTDLIIQTDRDNLVDTSTIQFEVDGTEHMRIHTGGNVGIGTQTVQAKLHVNAGAVSTPRGGGFTKFFFTGDSAITTYLELQTPSGSTGDILFSDGSSGDYGIVGYNHANDSMYFYTNSSPRMLINSSGNVGIGTTSPNGKLHISGISQTGTNTALRVQNDTNNTKFLINSVAGDYNLQFKNAGNTVKVFLDSNGDSYLNGGNVGIGETSPSSYGKLTVSDSSTNARIISRGTYNSGVHYFTAQAFPTDINGGRVSIGSNALVQTAYSDAITRLDTTRGAWSWVFQTQNSTYSSSDKASLQYMSAGGTQSQRLSINASGKLAIGGDNTDGFLEVRQSDNTPSIRLNNGSNPNGAYYDILSNTGGNLYLSRNGSTVVTLSDTNGNVGIGTTDVNAKLRVVGGDVVVTGGKLGIGISSPRADITVDHVIDTLPNNTVEDTDAWNNTEKSHIFIEGTNNAMAIGISGGNNTRRGWLQVGHNNTSFANATGRLLLQPLGGLVGIGLYDAETPLHIKAATAEIKLESSDTGGGAGDVLGGIDIWGNDFSGTGRDSRAYIKAVYEDVFARTALTFGVGPYNTTATETVRFPSTGGITFNGDTAAANALDDYEEGTWTPSFGNASSTVSVSHSYSVYTKIGNKITVNTRIVNVNTSSFSSSDTVYVHGLPYTSSTRSYAPVYLRTSNTDSVKMVAVEASSTYFIILDTTMADFVSSATDIWITLTYFV